MFYETPDGSGSRPQGDIKMMYGYARVSTEDQSNDIQIESLAYAGCDIIRAEQVSGTSRKGRHELETLLQFMRRGDVLMVTRLDRLARSLCDLSNIVDVLTQRGCSLRCIEQPVDTTTASGRAFLQMLGVFAEFETGIRKERQMEGIAKAKAKGVYRGSLVDMSKYNLAFSLKNQGLGITEISKKTGYNRTYLYKLFAKGQVSIPEHKQKRQPKQSAQSRPGV